MSELLNATAQETEKTANFELELLSENDPYAVSQFNENMGIIDEELQKTPLDINGVQPDPQTRSINLPSVPLSDNFTSDDAQINSGTFIVRTSGGESSIANGDATVSGILGNMVKTGYVEESIKMTVNSNTIEATIDRDTFVAYVANSGTIALSYSNSAWSANPALYGITISGTPENGDSIIVAYVKGDRGVIAFANPSSFVSTGWNLYNHVAGYARVLDYSEEYGYMVSGTYTKLEFSATLTGEKQTITPVNGYFTVPSAGYLFVTGGNDTDTEIWLTWGDWIDEPNGGTFEAYTQTQIDLSGLMVSFPDGLMRVDDVCDEINFNTQRAISRIDKLAYSAENLETVIGYAVPYDTDRNYIYFVKPDPDVFTISLSGGYKVSDHGLEMFIGTNIPVTLSALYGEDLKGKLRRDVVTISNQELTDSQKAQIRQNIGAVSQAEFNSTEISSVKDVTSGFTFGNAYATGDNPTKQFSAWGKIRALRLVISPKNANAGWTTIGTVAEGHRPISYISSFAIETNGTPTPKHVRVKPDGVCEIYGRAVTTYSINLIWLV